MMDFPKFQHEEIISDQGVFVGKHDHLDKATDDQVKLLELSEDIGWQKAIKSVFSSSKYFINYVTDEARLSVLDDLPFEKSQNILEIGPGYGQMSKAIARKVSTLDAIEADAAQARFCRIRLDQDGVDNVRIFAGGSEAALPYVDRSFDGVVMNLVFEWCAVRSALPHEQVQQAYLAEIARVLKPGGFLFLSTKNRFASRLLVGGRDEHMANKRFGSALPRAVGRLLMGRERPHGYLHSFNALRDKIESAGFNVQNSYWAVPEMRWPSRLIPLDNNSVRDAQKDDSLSLGGQYTHHLMRRMPASWVKHITPGLIFLARRSA